MANEAVVGGSGVVRPWQGTLMGVLYIIGAVLTGLGVLAFLGAMSGMMGETAGPLIGVFAFVGAYALVILVPLFVLNIFMARGFWKGQKWAVIVALVLSILAILSELRDVQIVSIVINLLIIWVEVLCFKHPFYNRAK